MWLSANGGGIEDAASSTFVGGIQEQGKDRMWLVWFKGVRLNGMTLYSMTNP